MTLFDQMEKRPGTTMAVLGLLGGLLVVVIYGGLFVGAVFVIKWILF